jgi:glycosidase
MVSVDKRFFVVIPFAAFVYCSISYFGCTKEKYSEMNARHSEEWVKNAVIDEIDLRSFPENGSFKALELQIPVLKKHGITVLSLMPIHPLGELNRKGKLGNLNAVKDFYAVNPEFGDLEDFKSLVSTTHQQGLKIIFNLVAGQAAWDSQLLMEHPDWFVHNEEGAIVSPNSERSDVAQIDYRQHEPRKYMIAVMKFWVQEIGIDGFQSKNAELIPTDFWDAARNELDKIKPVIMISESMLPAHHIKAFDLTPSWDMKSTVFDIIGGKILASSINDSLNAEIQNFPKGSLHLRFKLEHEKNIQDTSDIEIFDLQGTKAIAILAFTLPGVPLLCTAHEVRNNKHLEVFNTLYDDVITLHRNHPALRYGSYRNIQNSARSQLFSFIRFSGEDSVLIIVNFAHEKKETDIHMPAGVSLVWKDQCSGICNKVNNSHLRVAVVPLGFLAMVPSSEKEIR